MNLFPLPPLNSERKCRGVSMRCEARISPCQTYRHELWRRWDDAKPYVNFILLNPSTATAETDDPTLLRCVGYAMDWGFGAVCITNLFDFRATDPAVMKASEVPSSIANDETLARVATAAGLVVCGWGTHGRHHEREQAVIGLLGFVVGVKLHCLKRTKDGFPAHPLYLKSDLKPTDYL